MNNFRQFCQSGLELSDGGILIPKGGDNNQNQIYTGGSVNTVIESDKITNVVAGILHGNNFGPGKIIILISGKWTPTLIGGKTVLSDKSLEHSMRRKVREELTGCEIETMHRHKFFKNLKLISGEKINVQTYLIHILEDFPESNLEKLINEEITGAFLVDSINVWNYVTKSSPTGIIVQDLIDDKILI